MPCATFCRRGCSLKKISSGVDMVFLGNVFSGLFREKDGDARSDEERIAAIRKIAESCPTGRKVISEAFEKNPCLKIRLSAETEGYGVYNPRGRTVFMNPAFSDEKLVTTLIHEVRHAVQGEDVFERASLKSMIMATRASEADATAYSAAVAAELGGAVRREFVKTRKDVFDAYSDALKKNGNERFALADAFKAWYDDRSYVAIYDNKVLKHAKQREYVLPLIDLTPERILAAAVPADKSGGRYLTDDASFLLEPRFLTLARQTALKGRFVGFLRSDKSLKECFVTAKDGTVMPPRSSSAVNTASAAFFGKKGRGV